MYYTLNSFISTTITSSDFVMNIIYWLALIPCISSGCAKGKRFFRYPLLHIIFNSTGGGWLRDTVLLATTPWVLTSQALPDLLFIITVGIIYSHVTEKILSEKAMQINSYVINFLDAIGLASFIAIGVDKAINLGFDAHYAIVSGYLTASAGGCLAYFMNPRALFTKENFYYHLVIFMNSILYFHLQNAYVNCVLIPLCLLIGHVNYHAIAINGYSECLYSFSTIDLNERICSLRAFFTCAAARATDYYYLKKEARYHRVYLAFHRHIFVNS